MFPLQNMSQKERVYVEWLIPLYKHSVQSNVTQNFFAVNFFQFQCLMKCKLKKLLIMPLSMLNNKILLLPFDYTSQSGHFC